MYICVEGGIGVGKTSLTDILSKELKMVEKLEIVEENPYLKDFYADRESVAFQTEMFFLTHRYGQLEELAEVIEYGVVSDYTIFKNKLFANINLQGTHLNKFNRIFNILAEGLPEPDLLIFLRANVDTLQKRIAIRNREFEQNMEDEYLQELIDLYDQYLDELVLYAKNNILVIECDNIDFVNNREDRAKLVNDIRLKVKEISGKN